MLFNLSPLEIIGILIFVLLIFLAPWFIRSRIISSVTKGTVALEDMVNDAQNILVDLCKDKGRPTHDPTKSIKNFMEFFVIPPVDLDPYKIVKKFEKILDLGEERFKYMTDEIAPNANPEWRSNVIMTLKSIIAINSVAKLVRHNLELAKKTGNLQILIMLQMSLPLIMRIVKAQFEGTKAFSECRPIGDGLGPLVAGLMLKEYTQNDLREMDELVISKKQIDEHNVTIVRAKGPGGRIGKLGKVLTTVIKEENINRIITVDAATKLEGEKTGKVAEGIGIVIGGLGVDKWMIEEELLKRDIKFDAVIVKMSPEEAISDMKPEIADASKKALEVIERSILMSKKGSNILVAGVGNSCGLPNIITDLSQIQIKKENEKSEKEGRRWLF
jgi:hypothetical protein